MRVATVVPRVREMVNPPPGLGFTWLAGTLLSRRAGAPSAVIAEGVSPHHPRCSLVGSPPEGPPRPQAFTGHQTARRAARAPADQEVPRMARECVVGT